METEKAYMGPTTLNPKHRFATFGNKSAHTYPG